MRWSRRGQSTVEYAVVAAVVVGALIWMSIYMKRGVQGKLKESTDQIGEQFTPSSATYKIKRGYEGKRDETTTAAGAVTSAIDPSKPEKQTKTGSENPSNSSMVGESLFNN